MHLSSCRYPLPSFGFKSLHPCPACFPLLAQAEREEEEEGEEEGSLIEIAEEADLIQADRVIEEEEVVRPRRRKKEENGAVQQLSKILLAMRIENYGPGTAAGQEQPLEEWEVNTSSWPLKALTEWEMGVQLLLLGGWGLDSSRNRPESICSEQACSLLFSPASVAVYSPHPHN